jgi:hypothetical protein
MLPFAMRDEPFFIRREIGFKWRHYGCEHTANALARGKTIDCGIVRHFLILPSSFSSVLLFPALHAVLGRASASDEGTKSALDSQQGTIRPANRRLMGKVSPIYC